MKTSRRRSLGLTATALALTLVVGACSDSGGTVDPGADGAATGDSDGTLVLYSGRTEDLVQPLVDDFTAATGIEVEVRYAGTGELASQIAEEGDSSPADVFFAQDAGALGAVSAEGLFAALPEETLEQVPETYRAPDGSWVGVSGRARVLVYSEASVDPDKLPKSVLDLTAPEWNGRVGVAPTNASFQSFVTALRVQHGDDVARDWLSDLAANAPVIHDGNAGIIADVEADALDVGLVNHYYAYAAAAEAGVAPEDLNVTLHFFGEGDTGALVNVAGVGIVGEQEDGDAQAFVDHLLSPEGQEYFRDATFEYPLIGGLQAAAGLPPLEDLEVPDVDLNDLADLRTTVQMISEAGLA